MHSQSAAWNEAVRMAAEIGGSGNRSTMTEAESWRPTAARDWSMRRGRRGSPWWMRDQGRRNPPLDGDHSSANDLSRNSDC